MNPRRTLTQSMAALVMVALFLLVPVVQLASAMPSAAANDYDIAGGRFFTQANGAALGTNPQGFSVVDDPVAPLYSEYKRLGGVDKVGYPNSRRFIWNSFVCQGFQKGVLQWRADLQQAVFVNVFDQIHDQNKDSWLTAVRATPGQLDPSFDSGKNWEQIKDARWALLEANPGIKAAYYAVGDPFNLYGLPTSKVEDMGLVYVLRAQRVIIQQWKEATPWAAAGQVTIANGGDVAKEAGLIPAEALALENPPTGGTQPQPQPQPQPEIALPVPSSGVSGVEYGMCVDPGNDLPRALAMLKQAGFGWAKVQLRWESLEGSKGAINWGTIDSIINTTNGAGVKLLLSVVTAPRWSRPADTDFGVPGPPANPQDFADFLSAIVTRHKGKVNAIEVWNEQNLWYEWGGQGGRLNAAQYVQLLAPAYQAIKAADPGVTVLSGALTPTGYNDGNIAIDDAVYLSQMYAAGVKNYSDAIAAHPSGYNNPTGDVPGVMTKDKPTFKGHMSMYYRRFEQLRKVMEDNGDGAKKLWFTEFGWASSSNPHPDYAYAVDNSESDQADYLVQAFQLAKQSGYVGVMAVWNLNYAGSAEPDDRYAKKAFSILYPDWRPRPAYGALAGMPK